MLQPLLYHHLIVIDFNDTPEVEIFIKKMKMIAALGLEKYLYNHFKFFFSELLENNKLDKLVIQSFLLISSLYGKMYPYAYDVTMINYIDTYFSQHAMSSITI